MQLLCLLSKDGSGYDSNSCQTTQENQISWISWRGKKLLWVWGQGKYLTGKAKEFSYNPNILTYKWNPISHIGSHSVTRLTYSTAVARYLLTCWKNSKHKISSPPPHPHHPSLSLSLHYKVNVILRSVYGTGEQAMLLTVIAVCSQFCYWSLIKWNLNLSL